MGYSVLSETHANAGYYIYSRIRIPRYKANHFLPWLAVLRRHSSWFKLNIETNPKESSLKTGP